MPVKLWMVYVVGLCLISATGCVSSIKQTVARGQGNTAYYDRRDYTSAEQYYRKAAQEGDAEASYLLSRMLLDGVKVPQNIGEGMNRLGDAAARGHVRANRDMGLVYMYGKYGVEKSVPRAIPYFERAAGQGDDVSAMSLAVIYGAGIGVPKNSVQSARWFSKSRDLGLPVDSEFTDPKYIDSLKPARRNSSGPSAGMVKEVQILLNQLGYKVGRPDGVAGKKTRGAILSFQHKYGMVGNGKVTRGLLMKLRSVAGK